MEKIEVKAKEYANNNPYYEYIEEENEKFPTYDKVIEDYTEGYKQGKKDVVEELNALFGEFMTDCIDDNTDTHILHFIDVFSNKIKELKQ